MSEGRRPRRPSPQPLDQVTVPGLDDDLLAELHRRRAALDLIDALDDLVFELEAGREPSLAVRADLRRALESAVDPTCPPTGTRAAPVGRTPCRSSSSSS
jgi:hypothetical protein